MSEEKINIIIDEKYGSFDDRELSEESENAEGQKPVQAAERAENKKPAEEEAHADTKEFSFRQQEILKKNFSEEKQGARDIGFSEDIEGFEETEDIEEPESFWEAESSEKAESLRKKKTVRKRNFRKHKRMILTAVLIGTAALLLGVGGYALHRIHEESDLTLVKPYSEANISYQGSGSVALETAQGFSANLCVGENDQALGDISFSSNECGALFSLKDHSVLFSRNMYQKIYPASITKLMTALLAFQNGNLDEVITISKSDLELEEGSQMIGFEEGDKVVLRDLLTAMLVYSGNDAAQAIARTLGGTTKNFVDMMNSEADALGAVGTHFVNPSGLHDENHYTTVYDIYLILNAISDYQDFYNMAQNSYYILNYTKADGTALQKRLDSTDYYLTGVHNIPKNVSILGGKTGTTSKAGSCLALLSQNAYGDLYVSIVVKAPNKEYLYQDMDLLLGQINA